MKDKIKYFSIKKVWDNCVFFGIGFGKWAILICIWKYVIAIGEHIITKNEESKTPQKS